MSNRVRHFKKPLEASDSPEVCVSSQDAPDLWFGAFSWLVIDESSGDRHGENLQVEAQ